MIQRQSKIGIIGAGGWGTALSIILSENFERIKLWCFEPELADLIKSERENKTFLEGVKIPENIYATHNPDELNDCEVLIFAIPVQFIRGVLQANHFDLDSKIIVNVSKGIENGSLDRASELFGHLAKVDSSNYVVLTGPSHAEEAARGVPTAVLAASENHSLGGRNSTFVLDSYV